MASDKAHTIVLLQPGSTDTRTYTDYESLDAAVEGLCEVYEENLRRKRPDLTEQQMEYTIEEVISFYEGFRDLNVLIFDERTRTYCGQEKPWIIERLEVFGSE